MRQRWQRQVVQPSHADDWLMTYADVITLLLCFFAVSLAVSMPKQEIKSSLGIVHSPEIVHVIPPQPLLAGNLPFHEITDADIDPDDSLKAQNDAPAIEVSKLSASAASTDAPQHIEAAPASVETPPLLSTPAPTSLNEIVANLKTKGNADLQQKGDRITTLQMDSAAFFDSGSATLSAAGKAILMAVKNNLLTPQFQDYQITVEGHTDDTPIHTAQFPSNWELSTARASAVVHFFLDEGIKPQRLRAAGYADSFPIAPNRDNTGKPIPENQAKNRRVVINLERIQKAE